MMNILRNQKHDRNIWQYRGTKIPTKNDGGNIILDDLNEKGINDPRVQAMFKKSRHDKISIFRKSQEYYELPERTNRASGNKYHFQT